MYAEYISNPYAAMEIFAIQFQIGYLKYPNSKHISGS